MAPKTRPAFRAARRGHRSPPDRSLRLHVQRLPAYCLCRSVQPVQMPRAWRDRLARNWFWYRVLQAAGGVPERRTRISMLWIAVQMPPSAAPGALQRRSPRRSSVLGRPANRAPGAPGRFHPAPPTRLHHQKSQSFQQSLPDSWTPRKIRHVVRRSSLLSNADAAATNRRRRTKTMGMRDMIRGEFVDIIEWLDDTNTTLAWRFPRYDNEIKNGAQLIVREGQRAMFVYRGQLADQYTPGHYALTSESLPILSKLQGWKYGFNSPFRSEVYYVNTRPYPDLRWGTPQPVTVRDPDFKMVQVRANG